MLVAEMPETLDIGRLRLGWFEDIGGALKSFAGAFVYAGGGSLEDVVKAFMPARSGRRVGGLDRGGLSLLVLLTWLNAGARDLSTSSLFFRANLFLSEPNIDVLESVDMPLFTSYML